MNVINILLFVGVLLLCIISGLIGSKKAVGKKVINLVLLFASFIGATFALSSGIVDEAVTTIVKKIGGAEILEMVGPIGVAVFSFLVKLVLFDIVFWLIYLLAKLIIAIILLITGVSKFWIFKKSTGKVTGAIAGVCSGLITWFFIVLSLLPMTATISMLTPAINSAVQENNRGTNSYQLATTINNEYEFLTEQSLINKVSSVTGGRQLVDYAIDSFGVYEVELDGEKSEIDVYELLQDVGEIGIDVYKASELFNGKEGATYEDLKVLTDLLDIVADSKEISSFASNVIRLNISTDDEGVVGEMLACISKEFSGDEGTANFRNDIAVISDILNGFIESNKDKAFIGGNFETDVIDYFSNAENSDELVENLTRFISFEEMTAIFTNYGVSGVAEKFNIPVNTFDERYTEGAITQDDIANKIQEDIDIEHEKEDIKQVFRTALAVLDFTAPDGPISEVLLENFTKVGELLDALHEFSMTADVPETFLKAIAQQDTFTKYVKYSDAVKAIDKVSKGQGTYAEFCALIETAYKLANAIGK